MTSPDAMTTQTPSPEKPRLKKRWIALTLLVLLLIAAGIGGIVYWLHARQFEETDDAYVDGDVVPISLQVAGRIKAVHVADNQDVAAGMVLVELDPQDFATRLTQAQAALEAAQARLLAAQSNVDLTRANTDAMIAQAKAGLEAAQAAIEQAQAAVKRQEASVAVADAQVASAQADVVAAQSTSTMRQGDLKRYEAVDPRATSQQQRDAAKAAADAAEAQLSAAKKRQVATEAQVSEARARLTEAQAQVSQEQSKAAQAQGVLQAAQTAPQQIATAQAQVKNTQAAVDEARANVLQAQQQLSYTTITAPVSGRVTRKTAEVGQYVDVGQNLLTLVAPDVWVTANFKETQLTHMHLGQAVEIWVDTYPDRSFKGRVASIQAGTGARFSLMPPENATGNFVKVVQRVPVKIALDEGAAARQLLAPGMSVVPRVRVAGDEGTPGPITHGNAGNVSLGASGTGASQTSPVVVR